jgi:hypothetical protein
MTRKLRSLAALTTVALIGAGAANSFAADGNPGAPGKLPGKTSKRSSVPRKAPGKLPGKRSSRPKGTSLAPGKLPPR